MVCKFGGIYPQFFWFFPVFIGILSIFFALMSFFVKSYPQIVVFCCGDLVFIHNQAILPYFFSVK